MIRYLKISNQLVTSLAIAKDFRLDLNDSRIVIQDTTDKHLAVLDFIETDTATQQRVFDRLVAWLADADAYPVFDFQQEWQRAGD